MDDALSNTLKRQGYSDDNIQKINDVMCHPQAYKYAMSTGNFESAYAMVEAERKPQEHDLNEWFSQFAKSVPNDAKDLSVSLTKFARFVQSSVDKNQPSS